MIINQYKHYILGRGVINWKNLELNKSNADNKAEIKNEAKEANKSMYEYLRDVDSENSSVSTKNINTLKYINSWLFKISII